MRGPAALVAMLVASGCSGGEAETTETVVRTVTVTVTTTERTPATIPPRLPFPLPVDGRLPVDAFNAHAESVDEPWERDVSALTHAYVEAGASDAAQLSFRVTSSGEDRTPASASLTLDGLLDDSVRAQRYELELSRRDDGTWKIESASWAQRCQEDRGHQAFSPAPCL